MDLLLKSLIPFLLQTSLTPSFLFHNSMSQRLLGEASKRRKSLSQERATQYSKVRIYKKQDEKENLIGKMEGNSPMISFTLSTFILLANGDTI